MIRAAFSRLSTGIKMLLILSGALLPLGAIALLASIESANTNRLSREAEVRLVAAGGARDLSGAIGAAAYDLADTAVGILSGPSDPAGRAARCRADLGALADGSGGATAFALVDDRGRRLCATPGFSTAPVGATLAGIGTEVRLVDADDRLRFAIALPGHVAVGEFAAPQLRNLLRAAAGAGAGLRLRQGEAIIPIAATARGGPLDSKLSVSSPVAGGQLQLELVASTAPMRALEALLVLLPILMWLAAALIGWLVVDRLLLRPLKEMERAITAYGAGNRTLVLPAMMTPAQEIRSLGEAFRGVTDQLAMHERELEQGLARQTKLTREVHHRVKNNLQVVASLINLHARGVSDPAVSTAYATIQRRVDALAVVHRNHYAELEENRGVGLRPLVAELAQNLRATAPAEAAGLTITLDLMPAFANQDVAVPVAFVITELVEIVIHCDPRGGVSIRLEPTALPDRALLTIAAPGLASAACRDHPAMARFRRVLEGLGRQLRTRIAVDEDAGLYALEINIVVAAE